MSWQLIWPLVKFRRRDVRHSRILATSAINHALLCCFVGTFHQQTCMICSSKWVEYLNLDTCEILNIERNRIMQEKVLQDPNQSTSRNLATAWNSSGTFYLFEHWKLLCCLLHRMVCDVAPRRSKCPHGIFFVDIADKNKKRVYHRWNGNSFTPGLCLVDPIYVSLKAEIGCEQRQLWIHPHTCVNIMWVQEG